MKNCLDNVLMIADLQIVTRLPLEQLWRENKSAGASRLRSLTDDEITALLRNGVVEFVVADVGKKLQWIAPADCYKFWKAEIKVHLASADSRIQLDKFPDAYCYTASEWSEVESVSRIVLLERHH